MKVEKTSDGYILPVQVLPGSSQNQVRGEHNGRIKIAVSAAPEGGKANKALCKFLSKSLDLRSSDVSILSGKTVPEKEVLVEGVSRKKLSNFIR